VFVRGARSDVKHECKELTLDNELTFTRFDRMSEVYPDGRLSCTSEETFSYRRLAN